jgi:signal transduction histidine kinase
VHATASTPLAATFAPSETARWLRRWMGVAVGVLALVTVLTAFAEDMPVSHRQAVPVAAAVMVAAWVVELVGVPWPRVALVLAVVLPNVWLTLTGHGGPNYLFLLLVVAWVTVVGSRVERAAALVLSLSTLAVGLAVDAVDGEISWTSWFSYLVVVLMAWSTGLVLRRQDRLLAELRYRRSEAEQRGREMAALVDAARDLASTLELRPLLELMLDHLKRLVDHAGTSIWELDGEQLAFLGFRGPNAFDQDVARTVRFRVDEMGPHWATLARGEAIRMPDIRDGSDVARTFWRVVGGSAMRPSLDVITSLMWVPLVVRERPIGLLSLTSPERDAFSERDAALALAIARQAAVAIENARLHERARQAAVLEERERLARELHDSVTQSLYAVSLHAEAASRALDAGEAEPAASNLADIRETVQEALAEMRLLLFELRPPLLQEHGLAAALQTRLRAVEARAGLATAFEGGDVDRLRPEVEQELYRVAQEALNNVLKHAHASRATVRLGIRADRAVLEVLDDGVGFEPGLRGGDGYGLPGMRERTERLGGTLAVESAPGTGTRVRVEVPR